MFVYLVFFAALFMEGIGSYISILGLISLFSFTPVIILMSISIDIAKILGVSILYKYWNELSKLYKMILIPMVITLMCITSSGVFGYLSSQFMTTIEPNKAITTKIDIINQSITSLNNQKQVNMNRKKEIDTQIANLPPNYVNGRQKLMSSFSEETRSLEAKNSEIDKKLEGLQTESQTLKSQEVSSNAHIGQIVYISKLFKIPLESAISGIIGIIIFVFDPLAIMLILCGNFILAKNEALKQKIKKEETPEEKPEEPKQKRQYRRKVKDIPEEPKFEEINEKELLDVLKITQPELLDAASENKSEEVDSTPTYAPSALDHPSIQPEKWVDDVSSSRKNLYK
jgi:hypothetical protein